MSIPPRNIILYIILLTVVCLFGYYPDGIAQKNIYIFPDKAFDKSLGYPSGYLSVEANINDSIQQVGVLENFEDTVMFINLSVDSSFDLLNRWADLIFTYHNTEHGCITQNISFNVDTIGSGSETLYLNQFRINLYKVDYPSSYQLCNNGGLLPIFTDLPQGSYSIIAPSGLSVDTVGNIYPSASDPGIYTCLIESDYCIAQIYDSALVAPDYHVEPMNDTSFQITIFDSSPPVLSETLYYCLNSSNDNMPISNYLVSGINIGLDTFKVDPVTSGYYEVLFPNDNLNQCVSYSLVYIEVLPGPDQPLISKEELCDRVILSYDSKYNGANVRWSDSSGGNTLELTQSGDVSLEITDQYGCKSSDSLFVDFQPLEIESFDFSVNEADCWTEGTVQVNTLMVNKIYQEEQKRLLNTLNGNYVSDFDKVSEGVYHLEITDSHNCSVQSDKEIVIKQKCIEDYPVFSPNQDGVEDQYFIPHVGSIKIFDRNGTMLNEFDTPAYWDGTDFNGAQLPMGNYVMITDDGKPVNITLIR